MKMAIRLSTEQDSDNSVQLTAKDLVKCDTDGKVDWKTLGNIMTAKLLEQAHCVSFADFKYGQMTKEFKANIDWKFAYEEEGILIFKRLSLPWPQRKKVQNKKSNSLMSKKFGVRGVVVLSCRGVVDAPLNDVAYFVSNFKYLTEWNKFMVDSRVVDVIETGSQKDKIGYFRYESTKCLVRTRRDSVVFIHSVFMEDKFVQSYISVDWPTCPSIAGIPRVKVFLGTGWVLERYDGSPTKTLATYAANVDLNGPVPAIIMNRVLQREPLSIHYMRKNLIESRRRKIRECYNKAIPTRHSAGSIDLSFTSTATNTLDSTVNSLVCVDMASNKYEEPMGLADFIGRQSLSIMQKSPNGHHRIIPDISFNYQHSDSCDHAEHHGYG